MKIGRVQAGRLWGVGVCGAASIAFLALAVAPANAKAASPVLEFASSSSFPIDFEADGGVVTAEMTNVASEVSCEESEGEGQIIGPRSTLSSYVFTGCEAQDGGAAGEDCQSGAEPGVIRTGEIEADLVFIDQAKRQVGMLLNPDEGIYMSFECGAESVQARGSFLSPVGPINEESTSFTATLSRVGATQTPDEYENPLGGKVKATPEGKRESEDWGTSGVELDFAIETSAALEIKAITAAEVEAKQREDEAAAEAAAKKRKDDEAAAAEAAKKRQAEEAALAAVVRQREIEEAKLEKATRARRLSQCKKVQKKQKRGRCEKRVKRQYSQKASEQ